MAIVNPDYYDQYEGIIVTVNQDDKIVDCNQQFCELLGYHKSDLIDRTFLDLIVPEDKTMYNEYTYRHKESRDITIKLYHKQGAYRFFIVRIHRFDKHNLLFGHSIQRDYQASMYESGPTTEVLALLYQSIESKDISNLFQFDESLSLLLDLMPIDLWIKDRFNRYIFCNKSFTKHTGNALEDIYLKDDFSIYDNDIANAFKNSDQEAKESKKRIVFSFKSQKNNLQAYTEVTKIPVFNKNDKYIGIIGYSVDMTDEIKVETTLKQEREKIAFLLDRIEGIVFEINHEGHLVQMRGQLAQYFSEQKETDLPSNLSLDQADDIFGEKIQLALKGKQSTMQHTVNGLLVEFTFYPFSNANGTYHVLGYGKQVTENDRN
ncbi:MAG: PAS domain-containing protein [Candidatus Izemoplasma sp.]|nr:PAS domain-containing protein [Candidatus Izemoplasma sp.]